MSLLQALGWSFVHFLWQGGVIALACWALLTLARSATVRYAIGCAGLLVMLAAPLATFFHLFDSSANPVAVSIDSTPIRSVELLPISTAQSLITSSEEVPAQKDWHAVGTALVPWLGRAWIAGILVIALWHAAGYLQLSRLRRQSASLDDFEWIARLRHWKDRLSIRRSVSLLVTERIDCPAVVGFLKPAILWPAAALTGLTPMQIDALLAHELAHIRRHDDVMNLVQVGIETVLFFHPCVWWLSRRVRQERENCCDDLAASVLGSRAKYADALVAMESLRQKNSLSLQANGGSLMKRIQRLLEPTMPRVQRSRGVHGAVILIALIGIASAWSSRSAAQEVAPSPSDSPTTLPAATTQKIATKLKKLVEIDPDYKLQPGDLVHVRITNLSGDGKTQVEEKRVAETGKISLPLIGQVELRTLSEIEAEDRVLDALKTAQPDVRVRLTIVERYIAVSPAAANGNTAKGKAEIQPAMDPTAEAPKKKSAPSHDMPVDDATLRSLGQTDPFFARLVSERDSAKLELSKLQMTLGKNAPAVVTLSAQIELLQDRLQDMGKALLDGQSRVKDATANIDLSSHLVEAQKLEQTLRELEVRTKLIAESQQKLIESANRLSRLSQLRNLNQERDSIVAAIEAKKAAPDHDKLELDQLLGLLNQVNVQLDGLSGPGEYYVGGQIARPGVYSMTGRSISLKQAMIAAGAAEMKDETLIQLVRRDPITRKESIKTVKWSDIRSSAVGDEGGDFYLLPDDQIMVGTKPPATQPATQPTR